VHNRGRGVVMSFLVPIASGMALQCLRWLHSGVDGRTGPEVTGGDALYSSDVMAMSCVGAG
jgi:hypothetical protein